MCKPRRQTIKSLEDNPEYEYVTQESVDVWPGWATRYIFKHKASGEFYAAMVYMDDDSSDGEESKEWRRVYPKTTVTYVARSESKDE